LQGNLRNSEVGRCASTVYLLSGFTSTFAQNPVPFVNQPLVPAAVAPGGAGFTLTVHGTGFISGAAVNWNGTLLATLFHRVRN